MVPASRPATNAPDKIDKATMPMVIPGAIRFNFLALEINDLFSGFMIGLFAENPGIFSSAGLTRHFRALLKQKLYKISAIDK